MSIKNRLDKLEARAKEHDITQLWIAYEETPGCYRLDDGRVVSEAELEALPGSGPALHGLIISYRRVGYET